MSQSRADGVKWSVAEGEYGAAVMRAAVKCVAVMRAAVKCVAVMRAAVKCVRLAISARG